MSETPALHLNNLTRRYGAAETAVEVLKGAELALWPGEAVALVAPSGAGKSTLLHLAGLLETPDGGEVFVAGRPTSEMSDGARTALRRSHIGFVYQFHHLMPEFSAEENIALPQMIAGLARYEAAARARELLAYLGLSARALANAPQLLLADEPTGNLDPKTADHVFATLASLVKASRVAALIATHNMEIAARMDRRVTIREGRVAEV